VIADFQAAVFDMDGVLIDSHPTHHAAWHEFFRSLGRSLSYDELSFILDGRTRAEILRHFLGNLPDAELDYYGRRKDEIFRTMELAISPVRGVIDFLGRLRQTGIASAVATSASEIRTLSTIERLGLSDHFQAVVTASDVTAGKPDPRVYRLACERLGIPPENCLAFDDAPAGVESARRAGMRCVGIASDGLGLRLLAVGAERVIPDFSAFTLEPSSRVA
jgi:HAD superfamily hydrolase (TIGR01509 family)